MRRVGVIQPKVVITARQHAGQLDVLPNLAGRDGGVRLWVAGRRTVVDAIEGVVVAAGIRHADDQIGAMCGLWMEERYRGKREEKLMSCCCCCSCYSLTVSRLGPRHN